jgi:hypothetical protein
MELILNLTSNSFKMILYKVVTEKKELKFREGEETGRNGGGELVHGILYAYIELPQ